MREHVSITTSQSSSSELRIFLLPQFVSGIDFSAANADKLLIGVGEELVDELVKCNPLGKGDNVPWSIIVKGDNLLEKLSGELDLEDWSDKDSNEATHFRRFLSETLRSIKICISYALPDQFSIIQFGKPCIAGS